MSENEEEDECPELIPIDSLGNAEYKITGKPDQRVPVTIVTGFLGKDKRQTLTGYYSSSIFD
jgi:hypothetical protein